MSDNKVKEYTDAELIAKMQKASGFISFPTGYFFCGVQSEEDTYNVFDDKMYLFHNNPKKRIITFVAVTTCTTNAGTTGLNNYERYNSKGCAVVKTNQWYYDLWSFGYHRGKMPALKQVGDILVYRDYNKNQKIEEIGPVYKGKYGINFHTAVYGHAVGFFRRLIGGWSVGCQVLNNYDAYLNMLNKVKNQSRISYVLLKEF